VSPGASGQTGRITAPIDTTRTVALRGNVHSSARRENEIGPTDPARILRHISINFKPNESQQADLDQLLVDQQDPSSPNFHVWLTPEQFGDRFGLSPAEFDAVNKWLENEGFQVTGTAAARNWIAIDGTAATVQRAFHTEIHDYRVNGEVRFANSSEPSLPASIAPLVTGLSGLNDFRLKPPISWIRARRKGSPELPRYSDGTYHVMVPDDYAIIYDIQPLYKQGFDGTGEKLVIVGQSDINPNDIATFRSASGLPPIKLQQILVPGTTDPGHVSDWEEEADLDLEWSGAVARNATIVYVYAPNISDAIGFALSPPAGTSVSAPVVSMSVAYCESKSGTLLPMFNAWINQGNAQGVTSVAASGDWGAAGCDFGNQVGTEGLAVDAPASVPGVTAVGGTEFADAPNSWSSTNSPTGASAQGYIPEKAWNDTSVDGLSSSGGGASTYYPKPAWQTNFSGVPAGSVRIVPDVALEASPDHEGYFFVTSDPGDPGCTSASAHCGVGGTSAAAPSFAGMIAILNQYASAQGQRLSNGGQGNINPTIYKLFTTTPNAFHDIVTGDNIVPCQTGTQNCTTGSYGYSAGPGYDPVTGLGSVDAYNLITQWYGKSVTSSTTTVTAKPTTLAPNASTTLTATVSGSGGAPTGSVSFGITGKTLGSASLSSTTASITVSGSDFVAGSNTVTAVYSGDSSFAGSSSTVTVTVNLPTSGSAIIPSFNPNPVAQQAPDASGYTWFFTVTLTETAGTATTLTGLSIGGVDYSAQIVGFFGTATVPSKGAIVASIRSKGYTAPISLPFVFSGTDASGLKWTQTQSVILLPAQTAAAISVISAPSTVFKNPAADPGCQWFQNTEVQELNGFGVTLTRFLANGFDESSQIARYFGSTQLPALGSLHAGVCWNGVSPPQTIIYELDGTDENGSDIKASASVTFEGPPPGISSLSVSQSSVALQTAGGSQSASTTLAVNVPTGVAWSVEVFPANRTTTWLAVVPSAGTGPGAITINASSAGLSNGVFKGTLAFVAPVAVPSYIYVPITFTVGTTPAYSISGQVTSAGNALSGVTINLSGSKTASTTSDSGGNYSFTGLASGNYTVTPSLRGYAFTPATASFSNLSANQQANFGAASSQKPLPDLTVTQFSAPTTGVIGGEIDGMTTTVSNQGSADAGAFRIGFFLSRNPNVTTADIDTGWGCNLDSMQAGGVFSCNGKIGIPASLAPGTYYLAAIADSQSQVVESDKTNNVRVSSAGPIALTPAAGAPTPVITSVQNGASFIPGGPIETGSWVTIFGSNLAPVGDSRNWDPTTEIVNGKLPLSLDGTSATVNGKAAVVEFISPRQINIQPPDDTAVGPVQVVVTTPAGSSNSLIANYSPVAPGLFAGTAPYLAAQHSDYSYLTPSSPAKPGEAIILWGTGFGPANPAVSAGRVFTGAAVLANKVTVTIGGQPATVDFAGIVGAGLVQINVHVPASINSGDAPLVATVGGVSSQSGANMIPIGK
jgi:uncharacterized protein (TIGR03437 family)